VNHAVDYSTTDHLNSHTVHTKNRSQQPDLAVHC